MYIAIRGAKCHKKGALSCSEDSGDGKAATRRVETAELLENGIEARIGMHGTGSDRTAIGDGVDDVHG